DPRSEVPPKIVVGALDVGGGAAVALVLVGRLNPLLRELLGFLFRHGIFSGEFGWPLERRQLSEVPQALEIGMAVRVARHGGFLRLRRNRDGGCQQGERDDEERTAGGETHRPLLSCPTKTR